MITCNAYPAELKVFLNHVYEYKKGVRNMVLYTTNKKYEEFAVSRLNSQNIDYCIQPIGCNKINLFFGRRECIDSIHDFPTFERTDTRGGFHIGSHAGLRYLRTMPPLLQAQSQMK